MPESISPRSAFTFGTRQIELTSRTPSFEEDGLTVVQTITRYDDFDAVEWVNTFSNMTETPSALLCDLFDGDFFLPLAPSLAPKNSAYVFDPSDAAHLECPHGSDWSELEFYAPDDTQNLIHNSYFHIGDTRTFGNATGRSSEGKSAPFFQVYARGRGYIVAVGWTGRWRVEATRTVQGVTFKTGIPNVSLHIPPHTTFRTSSVVVMPYEGDRIDGQNKWRRFLKKYFTPIGREDRPAEAPFCASLWGGMSTAEALARLDYLRKNRLPFDTVWMDAGWYGTGDAESPDEFEGDWAEHTGDWRVHAGRHPDGLKDVVNAVHEGARRFLLWFEPERVVDGTPVTKEHPSYFIRIENKTSLLLNLGDPDAWRYVFDTLCGFIEKLGIDIYRQDFNFEPAPYFDTNDTEETRGLTEILHINGLYRLWDALLARFPRLLIDNCASGGRRIDVETLKRSVPLWRSDAECPADFEPDIAQNHALAFGAWMPYSGTGSGRRILDDYRFRSAYGPGLATNYVYSAHDAVDAPGKADWINRMGKEYLSVRRFFSCDLYPLTVPSPSKDVWSAAQYHDDESGEGIVLAFRRENAPYETAVFRLRGLNESAAYTFTDADTGETFTLSGAALADPGLTVRLSEKRTSKLLKYRKENP